MRNTTKIEKKVKKKKIGLMIIILFLTISIFFIMFTKTNFFNVSKVDVENNKKLQDEELILASGLLMGENIFMVDTSEMEENLNKHPYIKAAQVKRKLPNKLVININERKAYLVLFSTGSYVLLDNEGIILDIQQSKSEEMTKLPQVNLADIKEAYIGKEVILGENKNIGDLINFLNLCKVSGLYDKISKIETNKDFGINFEVKSGTKVAFGDLNNVKYKISFAIQVLDKVNNKMGLTKEQLSKGLIDLTQGEDVIFTIEAD